MTDQVSWGWMRGNEKGDIAYSANSTTGPVKELRVSWNDVLTREQIIDGLAVIEARILETPWPPAP